MPTTRMETVTQNTGIGNDRDKGIENVQSVLPRLNELETNEIRGKLFPDLGTTGPHPPSFPPKTRRRPHQQVDLHR